jgi:N utilization substance protein A
MRKYDLDTIRYMNLFEKVTRARVKDCFFNKERLVFVINHGDIRKALGKNNVNIEKIERLLNRKIKIVEFNPDLLTFIRNLLMPLRCKDLRQEDDIVIITGPDTKTKGLMIGSKAQNLRATEEIVNKYFKIKEIKVI